MPSDNNALASFETFIPSYVTDNKLAKCIYMVARQYILKTYKTTSVNVSLRTNDWRQPLHTFNRSRRLFCVFIKASDKIFYNNKSKDIAIEIKQVD